MKMKFVMNETNKGCDVLIEPDKKWDDTTELEDVLLDHIKGDGIWASHALGEAIDKYGDWINHGDIELLIDAMEDED